MSTGYRKIVSIRERNTPSPPLLTSPPQIPTVVSVHAIGLKQKRLQRNKRRICFFQISCVAHSWPNLRRDLIIKCLGDSGFSVRTLVSYRLL